MIRSSHIDIRIDVIGSDSQDYSEPETVGIIALRHCIVYADYFSLCKGSGS